MTDVRFTPGPWRADRHETAVGASYWIVGDDLTDVALVDYADDAERVADAHLIAAAPDLYEALRLLAADVADYPAWQRPCRALDLAQAALAKAEGRDAT